MAFTAGQGSGGGHHFPGCHLAWADQSRSQKPHRTSTQSYSSGIDCMHVASLRCRSLTVQLSPPEAAGAQNGLRHGRRSVGGRA